MNEQPCWTCAKATDKYKCCWAAGKPRDDWDAVKIHKVCPVIHGLQHEYDTYDIKRCGGYEEDKR